MSFMFEGGEGVPITPMWEVKQEDEGVRVVSMNITPKRKRDGENFEF